MHKEELTLAEAQEAVERAQEVYDDVDRQYQIYHRQRLKALERLDATQRQFDNVIRSIRSNAPVGSVWNR